MEIIQILSIVSLISCASAPFNSFLIMGLMGHYEYISKEQCDKVILFYISVFITSIVCIISLYL